MNKKVLICWIGGNDLQAQARDESGPILSTLLKHQFDSVRLLYNYPKKAVQDYLAFISDKISTPIDARHESLTSPINFGEIYIAAERHLVELKNQGAEIHILLSPGTPAMQAIWILLGKTTFNAKYIQSSIEDGVKYIDIPFEISAEFTPTANHIGSEMFLSLSNITAPTNPAFKDIITRNPAMKKLIAQAEILAQKDVPVLINGETGTGKELFARAIHHASTRSNKPFIAINCGAIPKELVDSILFGHIKGAFTGAVSDKNGVFQQANGGTLFLDEFGELSADVQVRLLRVLQEGTFIPVGSNQELKCDVRIIAATHRNLIESIAEGLFREDLFYRVAVGVLHLPPLREREGDLSLLTDAILKQIGEKDPHLKHKYISVSARNIILNHQWKGNVRELQSSLMRAAIWSSQDEVTSEDIQQSLFKLPKKENRFELGNIEQGIDIQEIIAELSSQYIRKALRITGQNKTKAAELLGLKNYQTLNNWMEKYGIQ